jgi:hypothetical protein
MIQRCAAGSQEEKKMRKTKVGAIAIQRFALLIVLGMVVIGTSNLALSNQAAQGATTPYSNMAPIKQYLMDRTAEIALARTAAPESISGDADVMVLGRHGFETAAKGKNSFVCIVERSWTSAADADFWNPKVRTPICYNAAAAHSLLRRNLKRTELILILMKQAGRTQAQVDEAIYAAVDKKELPAMEPGAMCYMMSRQGTLLDGGRMYLLRATILAGIIFSVAYPVGQGDTSPKPDLANGGDAAYYDECLALAYRLPDGWKFAKVTQARAGQTNQKILFKVNRDSAAASAESLELDVLQTPTLKHPNMERFTILLALSLVHVDSAKNKITRDAYPVTVGGRSFYRSDLRQGDRALSVSATWYRGYAVVAWASGNSPQDLEYAANALSALSFGEDKRTADCFAPTN